MNELRFVCIEDDRFFIKKLIEKVSDYYEKKGYKVYFKIYTSLPKNIETDNIDAYFFDIEIKNTTTLNLIKKVRNICGNTPIIIVSQYKDYVFETVHLQIFDYIHKQSFNSYIENTLSQLQNYICRHTDSVIINNEGRIINIYFKDILYIEIKSHHFIIHDIKGNQIDIWKNYKDVFVSNCTLLKAHKSYVINIDYCESIGKEGAVLKGINTMIPISTRKYNYILKHFVCRQGFIR